MCAVDAWSVQIMGHTESRPHNLQALRKNMRSAVEFLFLCSHTFVLHFCASAFGISLMFPHFCAPIFSVQLSENLYELKPELHDLIQASA